MSIGVESVSNETIIGGPVEIGQLRIDLEPRLSDAKFKGSRFAMPTSSEPDYYFGTSLGCT